MALKFSIIVPTFGRSDDLNRCVKALGRLKYPPEAFEIIIVFDGEGQRELPDIFPVEVKTIVQKRAGPAAARNRGAAEAKGQYLVFLDDDCEPVADWLTFLESSFEQHPDCMVGGRIINALPDNVFAAASQLLVDYLYRRANEDQEHARFLTSNNMAVPREMFMGVGGFDTSFALAAGEDREFCRRWLNSGHRIIFYPKAAVFHAHALTLASFWRQHVRYGRGAYQFHKMAKNGAKKGEITEKIDFYVNLVFFPLFNMRDGKRIIIFLLFLLMQAATAWGYLREKLTKY